MSALSTKIECKDYSIYFDDWDQLSATIKNSNYSKVICIVDDNTEMHCLPLLENKLDSSLNIISIKAGERYKKIDTCTKIWKEMMHIGADRHSVVITLGGGVVGDMGGFCAATYMRGIDFVHIPTTLLSQVDSAVGGKLGVDLDGYKNMVGLIKTPTEVHIFPQFVNSLPVRETLSGFAEMIKHALIADHLLWKDIKSINPIDTNDWNEAIYNSVLVKHNITEIDPLEQSIRKKLNFGHTLGHAIESLNLKADFPLLHGEAIAIGMICESHISFQKGMITREELSEIVDFIFDMYDHHPEAVVDVEAILSNTKHDKKNKSGVVLCTLLSGIGVAEYNHPIDDDEMRAAIAYYAEV